MRIAKILLVVLFTGSLFVPAQPVHADIAPPPAPELGGLQLFQSTEVQMVYERVEMELESFHPEWDLESTQNRITVNAYFVMKNTSSVDESMQAVFPLEITPICSRIDNNINGASFTHYSINQSSFRVSVDGIPTQVTEIETQYGQCDNYPWAAFNVTFPVNREVLIKVSYIMESESLDAIQVLGYILETGAGWKGSIGSGYIIMKFPYTITSDAILSNSTPGYQILQNEVFWSFQNLEPTEENNIQISFVSPDIWSSIQKSREMLKRKPASPDIWLELIRDYDYISTTHGGDIIRDDKYFARIEPAFQQGISENPNNAELPAQYAQFKLYNLSPHLARQLTEAEATLILSLLNKSLALEPNNETAKRTLSDFLDVAPSATSFTPPPTIPPTATSPFTATPSITPSETITPIPSETPVVVTVIQTKLVKAPTATKDLDPAITIYPSLTPQPDVPQSEGNSSSLFFGALLVFALGASSGWILSKRQKK